MMFGKELAYGIAKHLEAEPSEKDLSAMTYGYNIDLDYGLYTKKPKEMRRREKKREKEREKDREDLMRRSRSMDDSAIDQSIGIRISVDSSLANTSQHSFVDPFSKKESMVGKQGRRASSK